MSPLFQPYESWQPNGGRLRTANFKMFANWSPDQKFQWLVEMLEFVRKHRPCFGQPADRPESPSR